ncbi:MAG: hypothetical protein ACI9DK_001479 [Vicingaceae bacterium]|jgi:hypothetical protein
MRRFSFMMPTQVLRRLVFFFSFGLFFFQYKEVTAQIVRIENDELSKDSSNWSGAFDLNIYSIRNNSELFKLAGGSQLKYTKDKNSLISINEFRLIFAEEDRLESKGHQHFRFQHLIDSVYTLEAFSQTQFDEVLQIRLRQLFGIGPRIHFFSESTNKLFLGVHYMYEYEEELETNNINRDHRISSHFAFSRKMEKSAVHWIVYYQPKISNFKDYRVSGSATYTVELIKKLRFNIRGELAYDSNPVVGVNDLTYTFLNGFSWEF